jgi:hypothetical protein
MRTLLLFFAALLLGGCATLSPEVRVQTNPGTDFDHYHSFAFFSPLGTDKEGYSSILSRHLRDATRQALEARGYRYEANQPDLWVNFNVEIRDKTDVVNFPGLGYYGYGYWGRRYGLWGGYEVTTVQYQEGTLNIDLIDVRQNQLVWEGVAEGRVTQKSRKNLETTTQSAVKNIFSRYPYRAGER